MANAFQECLGSIEAKREILKLRLGQFQRADPAVGTTAQVHTKLD